MKADRYFIVSTIDKLSKMFMLVFVGVVLGTVLIRTYYDFFAPDVDTILGLSALYCVFFVFYMYFSNKQKSSTHVAFFKDYLSVILTKKNSFKQRTDIAYSDIKSYKVSLKGAEKNKNKEKSTFRAFGYKTLVETYGGQQFEFCDSKEDGVLIYSPAYIYALLDVKRFRPDFNLEFENFEFNRDVEDFNYQFKYYEAEGKSLQLWKNRTYLLSLLQYTVLFCVFAFLIAAIVSYAVFHEYHNIYTASQIILSALKTLAAIVIPMWTLAFVVSIYGGRANMTAQNILKEILCSE